MSKKNRKIAFVLFGLMLVHASVFAQTHKFTVSGNVRDADNGEDLIGVSIAVVQMGNLGIATNPYGFYSISLPEGRYTLRFSYIGYAVREVEV
ncbi:MAG: carboxypeptidase-like regulatory domain-containing protein, partial [Tannerellaceae bacterium]|nr:carboxypeptidase-like regulatory domain-containing protein [Tannerellaceae bacterium]